MIVTRTAKKYSGYDLVLELRFLFLKRWRIEKDGKLIATARNFVEAKNKAWNARFGL